MVNFDRNCYSLIPLGFSAIMMPFLIFVTQKQYPEEFLRPKTTLSRNCLRKCIIWPLPSIIINLPLVKNAINSELVGTRN